MKKIKIIIKTLFFSLAFLGLSDFIIQQINGFKLIHYILNFLF